MKIFIFIPILLLSAKKFLLKTKISITSSTDKSAPTSIAIVVANEKELLTGSSACPKDKSVRCNR